MSASGRKRKWPATRSSARSAPAAKKCALAPAQQQRRPDCQRACTCVRKRDAAGCPRRTHTRRRADRTLTLATFHAGQAATPRVRRDARGWRAGGDRHDLVSRIRSARKMPGLGPDRDAQASKRIATGLSSSQPDGPYRPPRLRGGTGAGSVGPAPEPTTWKTTPDAGKEQEKTRHEGGFSGKR
jgi:hypothetical protein